MFSRTLITGVVAAGMLVGTGGVAAAQPSPVPAPSVAQEGGTALKNVPLEGLTTENYKALVSDLKDAGYEAQDGVVEVQLEEGTLSLPESWSPSTAKDGPQYLGGGWDGWSGPYVSFNRVDQGALIAGGGAALAGAICLIPAVGQVACVAAAALVAAGSYYVAAYGRCPSSTPNLRIYVWSRSAGCYN